jgi:hypothetical protein
MKNVRDEGLFLDAILVVGETQIKAHRVVLAVHSSFLKALFTSGLSESAAASPLPVALDDEAMDAGAVAAIVDCFYTGTIALTGANVCAVIRTANLLCVDTIERAACGFFVDRLEPATALDALRFARQLSEGGKEGREMHASVLQYVHEHFAECAAGAPYLELSAAGVAELLQSDDLKLQSEEDALEALRKWFEHDAAARQASLDELVPLIRFPQLPVAAQLRLHSHPLLRGLSEGLAIRLVTECTAAFAASAEAAECPRLRRRNNSALVASEAELVAAVAQGGEVVVRAGVTIELGAPLVITNDCTIVAQPGGVAPTLLGAHDEELIQYIEESKSVRLRLEGMNLVSEHATAVYYRGGQLELCRCSVVAVGDGVCVGDGCQARIEQGVVRDCGEDGLYAYDIGTHLVAVGVTIEGCKAHGVCADSNAEVQLEGCALRRNEKGDCFEVAGGEIESR